jgi:hypothetical protein
MLERYVFHARGRDYFTYKDLFGVAYPPGKIQNIAIGLNHLGRQLNSEPVVVVSHEQKVECEDEGESETYI